MIVKTRALRDPLGFVGAVKNGVSNILYQPYSIDHVFTPTYTQWAHIVGI